MFINRGNRVLTFFYTYVMVTFLSTSVGVFNSRYS